MHLAGGAPIPRGRPVAPVELSEEAEAELTRISRSRSLPSSLVQRAQIVLACAVGASNTAVAARLGVGAATVGRWRRRYRERGLEGLHDELRPGRPRTYDDERVATVINDALQTKPPARTHWSVRAMASHSGISKSTVQRWFKLFGLQPHRHQYFKLSTDPFFIEKVRDIVGLYLDPPDHAVVLCVDEKSQIQALQRSQPVLPMGLGYVEGVTHDYWRHGTTTLFAALEVATGTVITDCKTRHRHQEFLGFLRRIVALMPADVPRLPQIAVNGRLLAFAAGLVVVTALAFGSAPAVQVLRQSTHGLLREQRTGTAGARLRRTLVAAEVALALVLLVGAGLLVQSFARLVNVDLGFAPANTAALQVFHYPDGRGLATEVGNAATANFFRQTLREIRTLPGVTGAGAVSSLPLALADVTRESTMTLHDRPPPPPGEEPSTTVSLATPGYFETMRIPLQAGRWFDERDDPAGRLVAVVNETLARQHWPEADPLDERVTVQLSGQTHTAEIVFVYRVIRQ